MIAETVEWAAHRFGLERLGFLTLTFKDHVTDKREAQRRFHSLATHVLADRYDRRWLVVWERQASGRLHAHLLVVLPVDIRTGCDFEAFARQDYRSAPVALRREWKFWRDTAPRYGFGRTELLPVKSNKASFAAYVGKYLGKDLRASEDAGVRRYSVGAGLKVANQNHQSVHSTVIRKATGILAGELAQVVRCPATMDGMAAVFGRRWQYGFKDELLAICSALRRSEAEAFALARSVARRRDVLRIARERPWRRSSESSEVDREAIRRALRDARRPSEGCSVRSPVDRSLCSWVDG